MSDKYTRKDVPGAFYEANAHIVMVDHCVELMNKAYLQGLLDAEKKQLNSLKAKMALLEELIK